MSVAVRYYSRSGNTKLLAEAISKGAETSAISVDAPEAKIEEKADVLFIGGALYAYGLDKNLREYLSNLNKENIGKAVIFSTSWISKHSITLIKEALVEKGITVEEEYFYAKSKPSEDVLSEAENFAKKFI